MTTNRGPFVQLREQDDLFSRVGRSVVVLTPHVRSDRVSLSEEYAHNSSHHEHSTDHNCDSTAATDSSLSSCGNHYASICEHCCRKYEPRYALGPGHTGIRN